MLELVNRQSSICYVCIPDALTHVFQPLNLGIIAAMKASVLRRMEEFLEQEVLTAVKENREVMLSTSRPVLRNRVTTWIQEVLQDPLVCSEKCCLSGFNRAGVTRVLYGDSPKFVDVDAVVPPPVCSECGEIGLSRTELPECDHFLDLDSAILCSGCLHNHINMCSVPP